MDMADDMDTNIQNEGPGIPASLGSFIPISTYKAHADVHHVNVRVHNRTRRR